MVDTLSGAGDSTLEKLIAAGLSPQAIAELYLRRQPYLALRKISCDVREGILRLRGSVPEYHLKQLAESTVCQLPGYRAIENLIEVTPVASRT